MPKSLFTPTCSPAPWSIDRGPTHPHFQIRDKHNELIAYLRDHRSENERDAALIAAAPDMLAALQAWVAELEEQVVALGWDSVEAYRKAKDDREAYALAINAIQKATTIPT